MASPRRPRARTGGAMRDVRKIARRAAIAVFIAVMLVGVALAALGLWSEDGRACDGRSVLDRGSLMCVPNAGPPR